MPIQAVKIPQNVYVEDRIVGPVTLKQLIIIGVGAGFSYACYALATRGGPVSVPLTIALWTPAFISAAFAFLKVNDLSLFNIVLLMIEHMNKPNERVWVPHQGISINIVTKPSKEPVQAQQSPTRMEKLADLSRQMDRRHTELTEIAQHTTPQAQPMAETIEEVETVPVKEKQTENTAPLPVNPARMSAEGLDPTRSVDGIAPAGAHGSAFDHLFQ